jgi:hypothetical protein
MIKILVCGGRDFNDYKYLKQVLNRLQKQRGPFKKIIHGAARGADSLAAQYAAWYEIPVKAFPADWHKHGFAAGPIRNVQMLLDGKPDLVIAFPGGKGTANMIKVAKAAEVEVYEPKVR